MNVSLHKKLLLFGVLSFLLFRSGFSQNIDPLVRLSVIQGDTLSYTYISLGNFSQTYIVYQTGRCGNFTQPIPLGAGQYKIIYPSNGNCTGRDTVKVFLKKPPQGASTFRYVEVTIIPSKVYARNDFFSTPVGQTASLLVVANDYSNRNVLNLSRIVSSNNGTAQISGNQLVFAPDAGFAGVTNVDYVVCDDLGTCDKATVHICVGDPTSGQHDTLKVSTRKNFSLPVITPTTNYTLISGPAHGTLTSNFGVPTYQPATNYSGNDYFTYTHNQTGHTKTVAVRVLNIAAPNQFVQDDVGFTSKSSPVEVNVLTNDFRGTELRNVTLTQPPTSGTAQYLGAGVFFYTPNAGFEGVEEFTYSASPNTNGSGAESGKVYIIVSNQNPAMPEFNLLGQKNTPLAIDYNIPISNFDFEITSQGLHGVVSYLPGTVDTVINGYAIQGYNLLVYQPAVNYTGLDEFEVEYCVGTSNNCPTVKVKVDVRNIAGGNFCVGPDCVWAGDVNKDGIVNLKDLLPMGWCIGDVGKPRSYTGINPWLGQDAPNWGTKFLTSDIDLKNIDADGDSLITSVDTLALGMHFQKNHSLSPQPVNFPTNIPLFLGTPDTIHVSGPGDIIEIPIYLGNINQPAINAYGLTFTIDFNPNLIDANQSQLLFENKSWMAYNSPVIGMSKKPYAGRMEAGYTRTNGVVADGYGRIGKVRFIIVDDLDIQKLPELMFIKISGEYFSGSGMTGTFAEQKITLDFNKKTPELGQEDIFIFPNPTAGEVNIKSSIGSGLESIEVFSLTGRKILESRLGTGSIGTILGTDRLDTGIYILRAKTQTGVVSKKFEVIK